MEFVVEQVEMDVVMNVEVVEGGGERGQSTD